MARDVQEQNIYERKTKVCIILETNLQYRTGTQSFQLPVEENTLGFVDYVVAF